MKDAKGHGSNARGGPSLREWTIQKGKQIDLRWRPDVSQTGVALPKPPVALSDYGRQVVQQKLAAHQQGVHEATKGKTL